MMAWKQKNAKGMYDWISHVGFSHVLYLEWNMYETEKKLPHLRDENRWRIWCYGGMSGKRAAEQLDKIDVNPRSCSSTSVRFQLQSLKTISYSPVNSHEVCSFVCILYEWNNANRHAQ